MTIPNILNKMWKNKWRRRRRKRSTIFRSARLDSRLKISLFKKIFEPSLKLNILLCTLDGFTEHWCLGENFEEVKWKGYFPEKPKMNGECSTTFPNITGRGAGTYCFCDSDGCNSSGATQLSFILFVVIFFSRFAF